MPVSQPMTAEEKRDLLCTALADAKALDLVILEVKEITILADYFILATATSSVHGTAIGKGVRQRLKQDYGLSCVPEGDQESNWTIMDYGDVVTHVLSQEMREFYALEKLWARAKTWAWEEQSERTGAGLDPARAEE